VSRTRTAGAWVVRNGHGVAAERPLPVGLCQVVSVRPRLHLGWVIGWAQRRRAGRAAGDWCRRRLTAGEVRAGAAKPPVWASGRLLVRDAGGQGVAAGGGGVVRVPQFAVGGAGVLAAFVLPVAWMAAGCSHAVPAAAARPAPAGPARSGPTAPAGSFRPGQLSAVAALSARAAWAVGVTTGREPLIEHWDGRAWS
jgi:hypothetical protein